MEKNASLLQRINHTLAWVTVALFIPFALSGYGATNPEVTMLLTGGVFTRAFSLYLHVRLAAPVLILLMIHILIGGRTALTRLGVREGRILDLSMILIGLVVTALIVWLQYPYF